MVLSIVNYDQNHNDQNNRTSVRNFFNKYFFSYSIYNALRKSLRNYNPDIIHLHNNYLYSSSVIAACHGYTVIQTVHDFGMVCFNSWCVNRSEGTQCLCISQKCYESKCIQRKYYYVKNLAFKVRRLIGNHIIQMFVVPSRALIASMEAYGYKNLIYLPNFSPYSIKQRTLTYCLSNTFNVLYVGRLQPEKGVDYLILALSEIMSQTQNIMLHVVGVGPEEPRLKKILKELQLENNVCFHGYIDEKDLCMLYESACVVVIPSVWMENNPLVAFEAMAYGIPIIASNIGGLPDIIEDGKDGFLVRPRNSTDIVEKILLFKENPETVSDFGNRLKVKVNTKFSLERYSDKMKKLYQEALNKSSKPM